MAYRSEPYRGTGGGAGATWRPGEQAQEQQRLDIAERQMYLVNEQETLNRQSREAIAAGDRALNAQIEARMAANAQEQFQLDRQRQVLEANIANAGNQTQASIAEAQARANVFGTQGQIYGSQVQGQTTLAGLIEDYTKAAAAAAANPRNTFEYLNLASANPSSSVPFSAATPGQLGGYEGGLTGAFNRMFQPAMQRINEAWDTTKQTLTPPSTTVTPGMVPTPQTQTPQDIMAGLSEEGQRYVRAQAENENSRNVMAGLSAEGQAYVQAMASRGQPVSASGGGKMTINEPSVIVGMRSGSLYATLSEEGPEKIVITPQKRQETAQRGGAMSTGTSRANSSVPTVPTRVPLSQLIPRSFAGGGTVDVTDVRKTDVGRKGQMTSDQIRGAMAFGQGNPVTNRNYTRAQGGPMASRQGYTGRGLGFTLGNQYGETMTDPAFRTQVRAGTVPSQPGGANDTQPGGAGELTEQQKTAYLLAQVLRAKGIKWNYGGGGIYAPSARLMAPQYAGIATGQPTLAQTIISAASASGVDPTDLVAELQAYTPSAARYYRG
ncbi:MAG TPA: hypothetical protein VNA25_30830 [Phycisphaerae bacterium]|nr:hypothetical protein [Phycisphaerae bacterium]